MSTKTIIRQTAKKHKTTVAEVREDLKEAIRIGMAVPDPKVRAFWKQMAPDGKEPSIDTVLKFCIGKTVACRKG